MYRPHVCTSANYCTIIGGIIQASNTAADNKAHKLDSFSAARKAIIRSVRTSQMLYGMKYSPTLPYTNLHNLITSNRPYTYLLILSVAAIKSYCKYYDQEVLFNMFLNVGG